MRDTNHMKTQLRSESQIKKVSIIKDGQENTAVKVNGRDIASDANLVTTEDCGHFVVSTYTLALCEGDNITITNNTMVLSGTIVDGYFVASFEGADRTLHYDLYKGTCSPRGAHWFNDVFNYEFVRGSSSTSLPGGRSAGCVREAWTIKCSP